MIIFRFKQRVWEGKNILTIINTETGIEEVIKIDIPKGTDIFKGVSFEVHPNLLEAILKQKN